MDIQLLNLNQTHEAASLCVSPASGVRAMATYRNTKETDTRATGTNGFWLNAPIFATLHHSRWKRPD